MDTITDEQRDQAEGSLTPIQQERYSSPQAGREMMQIAKSRNITEYRLFAIAVGDVILGLVPQEKLPALLIERIGVTQPDAMRITADVLDFLAPLDTERAGNAATTAPSNTVTENPVPINTAPTLATTHHQEQAATAEPSTNTIKPDVAPAQPPQPPTPLTTAPVNTPTIPQPTSGQPSETTHTVTHDTQPMRTMAADMQEVRGYSPEEDQVHQATNQEELLKSNMNPTRGWSTAQD